MALDYGAMFTLRAGVTGAESIDNFTGKLNKVGKTADNVNKQMASLNGAIKGLAAGFGASQVAGFVSEMARATIQLDAYTKQLSVSFGASSNLELETLRNTMRSLGIAQDEALGSAVRFTAAMKLSGQSTQEANRSFADASKLILSNKLSADGAQRVFYAMSQIASKGKLMSEELNGQLGDTLAGFTQQVAAAMNKSTAQLMEDMKDGTVSAQQFFEALNKIGDGIDPASLNSAAKSLGDLKNAWFDFKTSVIAVETIKAVLDGVTASIKFLAKNGQELGQVAGGLAAGLAVLVGFKAVAPILIAVGSALVTATGFVRAFGLASVTAMYAAEGLAAAMAILGGPVGIAILAAGAALAYFTVESMKADAKAKAFNNTLSELTARLKEDERFLPNATNAVSALGGKMEDQIPRVTKFAGEVGEVANQLHRVAVEAKRAREEGLLTDALKAQSASMSVEAEIQKQKKADQRGRAFIAFASEGLANIPQGDSQEVLALKGTKAAFDKAAGEAQARLKQSQGMKPDEYVTAADRTRIRGQYAPAASAASKKATGKSEAEKAAEEYKRETEALSELEFQFGLLGKAERDSAVIQAQHKFKSLDLALAAGELAGKTYDFKSAQEEANRALERAAYLSGIAAEAEQGRFKVLSEVLKLQGASQQTLEKMSYERDLKVTGADRLKSYATAKNGDKPLYTPGQIAQFSQEIDAANAKAVEVFTQTQAELLAAQANGMNGVLSANAEYSSQIQNLAGSVQSAWTNALKGTEDALVNFAMTGKLSFKSLANSIISDLVRIAIQQSIMAPLMQAFRGMGWLPAATGAAFDTGGVQKFATGGVVSKPTMFAHGGGLGVMGEAGPEAIMPLRRLSSGRLGVESAGSGGGTQNVVVNVSVEGGGSQASGDPGKANELGKLVANAVRVELVQQKRPGGLLAA